MKFDLHGIRFNVFKYLFLFSLAILLLFGGLQLVLIRPYYRDNKMQSVKNISTSIENNLLNKQASQADVEAIFDLVVNNDTCVAVYNENGDNIYYSDAIGEACMLHQDIELFGENLNIAGDSKHFVSLLKDHKRLEATIESRVTGYEMLVYGRVIANDLVNYYLVLNSPLEPVESVIDFILGQYLYIAIIVFVIAFVVALFLANNLSSPIRKMQKEALKLQSGHYNVHFQSPNPTFSEINDLALTLDNAALKLSKIDELRKDLLANVSHDIKTPLTMIQAYAEMIEDISGDDPLKRKEHLDIILKETDYLNKLITDMQELSKMQSGNLELKKDNFDLKDTVEDIIDLLDALFKEHQLKLVLDLKPVVVYADELKISQVIYNFLSNAIKHSPKGGSIYITIIDKDDYVRLEVRDEGEGINEEDLPYIWDRYYKIDKRFKRNLDSTGLGLAIAKAILEAHHARYGTKSKIGEGALFYFELSKEYEEENDGLSPLY